MENKLPTMKSTKTTIRSYKGGTAITDPVLFKAVLNLLDQISANGWVSVPCGYSQMYRYLFTPYTWGGDANDFGPHAASVIGQACLEWERKNENTKTIDYILPTLRDRQTRGEWHSDIDSKLELSLRNAKERAKFISKHMGIPKEQIGHISLAVATRYTVAEVAAMGWTKAVDRVCADRGGVWTTVYTSKHENKTADRFAFTR